jgi:hypothetical protein
MEILDPELQLQAGETGVVKGLIALNVAQDHLESLLAQIPGVMGSGVGSIATVASTETVAFPSTLLRLDKIQFLDPITSRPTYDLTPLYNVGGHANSNYWPSPDTASTGRPQSYWTDGTNIYFSPVPNDVYNLRWYGFASASNITASGTFAYKDIARLPVATFAVKLIALGLDDPQGDLMEFAKETFAPVLKAYERFRREQGKGFQYRYTHDT